MMLTIFYIQPTLNRLFKNEKKFNWNSISSLWNIGGVKLIPQNKLPSKSPVLFVLKLMNHDISNVG